MCEGIKRHSVVLLNKSMTPYSNIYFCVQLDFSTRFLCTITYQPVSGSSTTILQKVSALRIAVYLMSTIFASTNKSKEIFVEPQEKYTFVNRTTAQNLKQTSISLYFQACLRKRKSHVSKHFIRSSATDRQVSQRKRSKQCSFYKWIPGTSIILDAYCYGDIPDCTSYFL